MIIGVPKEIKTNENRVAFVPAAVTTFTRHGHTILIEKGAGAGSGFPDEAYQKEGAEIVDTAASVYGRAEMIMKVKEPIASEYPLIRSGQILFTYFHFAANRPLTDAIMKSKSIAIAYETVMRPDRTLPLLIPMSEIAGRMAPQEGAKYLERTEGGRGVLLGGVPGVAPGEVVVLGGGIVGTNAAKIAAGFGARVIVLDTNLSRLRYLDDVMPKNVTTMFSSSFNIRQCIQNADLLIGAVLVVGAKAPHLVTRDMLPLMKERSVVVDVSVDQGGCIETCKPTTHENPTYVVDGVLHYCVANMPGAVPYTSTIALTNATLWYALEIADKGYLNALRENNDLREGLNVINGSITHHGVAAAFDLPFTNASEFLN